MNIYLDIDGVLLDKGLKPALHIDDFLKRLLDGNDVYWLTTRCKGDAGATLGQLSTLLEPQTLELLKVVKATDWRTLKTEAIDFAKPFLWFDDNLFYGERQMLESFYVIENWIKVDLGADPNQLQIFANDFPEPIDA
jgi:hypothetical protein